MARKLLVALLAALVLAPAAFAQEDPGTRPPCLQVDGDLLGGLVGAWVVEWQYRTSPGEFETSTARSQISLDLERCALTERLHGTLRGVPYVALTMITRPTETEYDRVRVDTEHGTFSQSKGALVDGALVFEWQRDLGTRLLRTRHRFSEIEPNSFLVEFFMSPREDAPWELVQKASYTRMR